MGTTIESLPNEVLEMIFSILGGLPKLPMPGWAMMQYLDKAPVWVVQLKDVVSLSCTARRFYRIGQSQIRSVYSIRQHETMHFRTRVEKAIDTTRFSAVRFLYLQLPDGVGGMTASRRLGKQMHLMSSLKYLHMRFDDPWDVDYGYCCGAAFQFFEAIVSNPALDGYELDSFRYEQTDASICSHLQLWQAMAKLKVRNLAVDPYQCDEHAPSCPMLRRIAIGYCDSGRMNVTWQHYPVWRKFGSSMISA